MDVLVSGAGIAGTAAALAMSRLGINVTVVEAAPELRTGGTAVDFRGRVHREALDDLGVLNDLQALATGGTVLRFVDGVGRPHLELPGDFAGGDLELSRGDLVRVLHQHASSKVEFSFSQRVADLAETPAGVRVAFSDGTQRTFALVVGADGVHSGVRRLAFGPERDHVRHLGYQLATWDVSADLGADLPDRPGQPAREGREGRSTVAYNEPGRMISLTAEGDGRAAALAVFTAAAAPRTRTDRAAVTAALCDALGTMGWRTPALLASLPTAREVYFDGLCRVEVASWVRGRVTLLGDAAWGAPLGGMGNGTAVIGAHVLARELSAAGGDLDAGLAAYQRRMAPFARRCRRSGLAAGRFLAPRHASSVWLRNTWLGLPPVKALMFGIARSRAEDIELTPRPCSSSASAEAPPPAAAPARVPAPTTERPSP